MRKLLFLVISIFSLIIIGCVTREVQKEAVKMSETKPQIKPQLRIVGGITQEQPLSIGAEIYTVTGIGNDTDGNDYHFRIISYTYMGIDDTNNIRLEFKHLARSSYSHVLKPAETFHLTLQLNSKKQTMFNARTIEIGEGKTVVPWAIIFGGFKYGQGKELLITVVDEFSRITVEEVGRIP